MLVVLIGLRSCLFCLFNKLIGINSDPKKLAPDRGKQIHLAVLMSKYSEMEIETLIKNY